MGSVIEHAGIDVVDGRITAEFHLALLEFSHLNLNNLIMNVVNIFKSKKRNNAS